MQNRNINTKHFKAFKDSIFKAYLKLCTIQLCTGQKQFTVSKRKIYKKYFTTVQIRPIKVLKLVESRAN